MTSWLDIPSQDCAHEPNARGTACVHCGLTAELVTPDELQEALSAEIDAARLRAGGQTSWLDERAPQCTDVPPDYDGITLHARGCPHREW